MADETDQTPSKRVHSGSTDLNESAVEATTPKTGEKRKRGRPRKDPAEVTPKTSDGPKRGRGRPRKIITEEEAAEAARKAALSPGEKKGRGRPRKEPGTATPKSTTTTPKKTGRGRPRKSLPAIGGLTNSTTTTPKKDGRGRPRKSFPANGDAASDSPKAERTTYTVPKEDTGRSYWLMKAEPESRLEKGVDVKFSIDDLANAKEPEPWDGVRNPVARNLMREMQKGDFAFFYHSNCKTPGIVGAMEIVQEHSTDESAFDPKHPYYDAKSSRENPKWVVVHVEFRRKFKKQVTLNDLKENSEAGKPLENLQTLKQSRLSVSSVTPAQWRYILELADEEPFPPPAEKNDRSE